MGVAHLLGRPGAVRDLLDLDGAGPAMTPANAIDFADLPICENTDRNVGLTFAVGLRAWSAAVRSPRVAAVTITEVNPHHGERDGSTVRTFAAGLAARARPAIRVEPPPMGPLRACALASALTCLGAAPAAAKDPPLTVAPSKLAAALHCVGDLKGSAKRPVMLVTGTGASGAEAYAIGKGAFDAYGAPVCYVDFPDFTTGDIQIATQYLVYGLRTMYAWAGRRVAVFGISQGGLLPRLALEYWPSLHAKVTDVIAAAGTQHGTTAGSAASCAKGCIPAGIQQRKGSKLLNAVNALPDETPGPTSWTTVRSTSDETVKPQTGPHPASVLRGATNILIQSICPGRKTTHIGTALDSVTFAAFVDATTHAGPAKISRLPAGVCASPFAPGLDEAGTTALLGGAGGLTSSRYDNQPHVTREPALRAPFKRTRGT